MQHRNIRSLQGKLALLRDGGGVADGVVSYRHDHPAVRVGAGEIGVAQRIATAIHPGALAVPHREHAVVAAALKQVGLLGTPHHGGAEVLVDRRLKVEVMGFEQFAALPQRLVQPADRRTAVTGDKTRRIEAGAQIAPALFHRQARQRLHGGQVYLPLFANEFIVQRDRR